MGSVRTPDGEMRVKHKSESEGDYWRNKYHIVARPSVLAWPDLVTRPDILDGSIKPGQNYKIQPNKGACQDTRHLPVTRQGRQLCSLVDDL
jgi:hypothetical protein